MCRRQKGHLVARAAYTSRLGGGNSGAPASAARLPHRVRLTAVLQHLIRQVITLRRSIQNFISQHYQDSTIPLYQRNLMHDCCMHLACEHTKQATTLTATAAAAAVWRIGNSLQLADPHARQMKENPQGAADRASEPRGHACWPNRAKPGRPGLGCSQFRCGLMGRSEASHWAIR